jgi:hypothetical protein
VALADQISREFDVSDQGIDMEIEPERRTGGTTKYTKHTKTGKRWLADAPPSQNGGQANSLCGRFVARSPLSCVSCISWFPQVEIFTIKDERHARYWMAQAFPVLLVIRNSERAVRWMEVRDWLKRASDNGRKPVKHIVFAGERFDVMRVRRWKEKVLQMGLQ